MLIQEVIELWNKSGIPTRQSNHCIENLIKIHKNWLLLKQNKTRDSQVQKNTKDLDKYFDIAHANAMHLIKNAEDKEFFMDQRSER